MADAALCWCSVIAVGRCEKCERAFCTSHQAAENRGVGWHSPPSWVLLPMCVDCRAGQLAEADQARRDKAAAAQAIRQARVDAAHLFVEAMLAAGSPGISSWHTAGPKAPSARVDGWLLDGHGYAAPYTDARGARGHYYRNIILTNGHVGLAADQARDVRERVLSRYWSAPDAVTRTDAHLRRWFDPDARAYRRLKGRRLVVRGFLPFAELAKDCATSHLHGDERVHGISEDFGDRMAALAAEHGVAWAPPRQ